MSHRSHLVRLLTLVVLATCAFVIASCGSESRGDGGPSPVRAAPSTDTKHVIATLGDSIAAGSPLWDPDADVRAGFAQTNRESQWQYWIAPADDDQVTIRNCGVWGERTDEIVERFASCTNGADAIVIQGGINDIAQGRSIDDAARNLACIAERARRAHLDIAFADVLPWNRGWPDAAPDIERLNSEIHTIAKRGGAPVLPFFATLEDPSHRDRMPPKLTRDGNHPTVAGYRQLGEQAWRNPVRATGSFTDRC